MIQRVLQDSVRVKYQLLIHLYVSNLISNHQMSLYIYKEEVSNFISSSLNNQNNHVNTKFSLCFGPDNYSVNEPDLRARPHGSNDINA